MTRYEAMNTLEDYRDYILPEDIEALNMAIEALKDTRNCALTLFGDCSYDETGCSDCEIKQTIYKALEVDIVRCGECVHSRRPWEGKPWEGICEHPTAEVGDTIAVNKNDFCSYGERISDESGNTL